MSSSSHLFDIQGCRDYDIGMAGSRQTLTKRSVYGGGILFAMAVAVLALLSSSRDRLSAFRGEHQWGSFSGVAGAFLLDLPATWTQHNLSHGLSETQMVAARSSDTMVAVAGAAMDEQVPATATMDFWQGTVRELHKRSKLLLDETAPGYRESKRQYRTANGALYCQTEVTFRERKLFRDIPKWGCRVAMVSRKGVCLVECVTREGRKPQMEPVFRHVIQSLKPGAT
jgi:hypothetical protein